MSEAIPMRTFADQQLRGVKIDNEPWFVASDVCRCLGLGLEKGTHRHTAKLEADEKQLLRKGKPEPSTVKCGGLWEAFENVHTLISESGLYKLILRAHPERPEVKAFQNWVTREVLPAIRKTGGYLLNERMRETAAADSREEFPLPVSFSDALRKLADEVERREASERIAEELRAARERRLCPSRSQLA
jgi:prophage antirepressor-like protein